ncbi:RHS repeat domain-containing protein [Oleiagrimonas soli]|uniref:RHS repeat-associated protein n=1 Tax=Oleiagrimonas soli TaxID=1543381 RepID=A0A841KLF8_9GAMM|nr:RHS repeat-associated core domain-containing protein [Oleiagrimonas soli]MBB6184649.1 RHS repeat-associated protein [Oleiagrimonas soli]
MKLSKFKKNLILLILLLVCTFVVNASERVTLYMTNYQSSVVLESDVQGGVTYQSSYQSYGLQPSAELQAGIGYAGHVGDPDAGLIYMQARYYDPVLGRFLSRDPVAPEPTNIFNFSRYAYANNNPMRYTDPDGRCVDGVTCSLMFRDHIRWRMTHPNAPADGLEKVALVGTAIMAAPTIAMGGAVAIRSPVTYLAFDWSNRSLDVVEAMKAAQERQTVAELVEAAEGTTQRFGRRIADLLEEVGKREAPPPPSPRPPPPTKPTFMPSPKPLPGIPVAPPVSDSNGDKNILRANFDNEK